MSLRPVIREMSFLFSDPRRLLLLALPLTLAFRLWLAWVTPITGDEAYFIWWGWRPDWGFHDHPPMVGWWLAALLAMGDAEVWLRLPIVLQPALLALAVAWSVPRIWPDASPLAAPWAALLVLLAPVHAWGVFVTTDTPLVYFSVLSALAWCRAARDDRPGWYALSGLLLAGAVLSKYFVALLGFAYLVDALRRRSRGAFIGLVIAYGCTLPALGLMAWWNMHHCWANYLFNFVNRHEGGSEPWWQTLPLYGLTVAYLLSPPVLWFWLKRRARAAADGTLAVLAMVPFLLFALLATRKMVGLHWPLAFVPLVMVLMALRLPGHRLKRVAAFLAGLTLVQMIAVAIIAALPMETWKKSRLYDGIVLTVKSQELLAQVAPYGQDYVFASDGYSNAVTLGYNARRYFFVFGIGSGHARHDDIMTDLREYAGRNILVLRKSEPKIEDYQPYFRQVRIDSFEVHGARYWRVLGDGFDYPAYRDQVLAQVRDKYYRIPAWLPTAGCYFCQRYFPESGCAAPGKPN